MRTRLEIFRKGSWVPLKLPTNQKIKYNAVINKIGKISSREISHTNTFSIPKVWQNIQALDLNKFNPNTLTTPLNSKYEANYYVEDKLLQTGYIVINNIPADEIKLNFISGGLGLVDIWNSTTFLSLLKDPNIIRPADYQTNIDEISSYSMTTNPMVQTNQVGTRGHQLVSFPNNLNQLGDDFQNNVLDQRDDDSFIPYQSRPLFNAKALFDLSIESFGYTPIYDESINWSIVEDTFLTSKTASEGKEAADASQDIVYTTIPESDYYLGYRIDRGVFSVWNRYSYNKFSAMRFDPSQSIRPSDVDFFNPQHPYFTGFGDTRDETERDDDSYYKDYNTLFTPNVDGGNTGLITFKSGYNSSSMLIQPLAVIAHWNHTNPTSGTIEENIPFTTVSFSVINGFEITVDKTFLNTPPANADGFVGLMVLVKAENSSHLQFSNGYVNFPSNLINMETSETSLLESEVVFSPDGSYASANVDLTYAAHQDSIKELLVGVMNKEGMLMSIDDTAKTVKLFSYGQYEAQKESGNFYDWSDYFQKYDIPTRDTNYGKEYGRVNQISLTKPYSGNVNRIQLSNQDGSSKYKDFTKNEVSEFNDISKVVEVNNTTTPYFEYSLIEKGLVEYVSNLGDLDQINFDRSAQGVLSGLPSFANVNYLNIPRGVGEWYDLVDRALRVQAKFLLPVSLIKTFDISKPVYINHLGGFYIVEEISEYVDNITPVTVKLIKLIDNLRKYI